MNSRHGTSIMVNDLERDHRDGLSHKDGVCAWCDHVRQLESEGYYDFLKQQKVK